MTQYLPEIFYSDLNDKFQKEIYKYMQDRRPDLAKKVDKGSDVIIGQLFNPADYEALGEYEPK